jgi:hypothetical protein
MLSFFDMNTKRAVAEAFKKKEREARMEKKGKTPTYKTIAAPSDVGKAAIKTKGAGR